MNTQDRELIRTNLNAMMADIMEIGAETSRIQDEQRHYPIIALGILMGGIFGSAVAIAIVLGRPF